MRADRLGCPYGVSLLPLEAKALHSDVEGALRGAIGVLRISNQMLLYCHLLRLAWTECMKLASKLSYSLPGDGKESARPPKNVAV